MRNSATNWKIKNFLPILVIFTLIILYTLIKLIQHGSWDSLFAMRHFEGAFFIIFGGFKILNWRGFVEAYRIYDLIAKRSSAYAYAYPVIELILGVMYLAPFYLLLACIITLILMTIGAIGVFQALYNKKPIECACLGLVFKLPMTYVTLAEDLLMGGMAFLMIILLII